MTTKDIKRIIDDERAELLTAQACRHWQVATERLEGLVQELNDGMETCVEAEVYAAMMRMQSSVMVLMELNKMPCAYLFSEYFDRIAKTVSDIGIRQSVMALAGRLLSDEKPRGKQASFLDLVVQSMVQHSALSPEQQAAIQQKASPLEHIFAACAQFLKPDDLMMVASIIQKMKAEGDTMSVDEATNYLKTMREAMDGFAAKMSESLQMMLIWLILLMLLPGMLLSLIQQRQADSKGMALLFNKVLARVRESDEWNQYWKDYRKTLRVVNDSSSWNDIMMAERAREREELGKVPGGLFAKYTTDREAFEAEFLDAHLSDEALRGFIFHLATLSEIARELDPMTKFGDEQLVNNDLQHVGEAVLTAARKLNNLVAEAWLPYYDKMWQELIENETIFAQLKVTRKSPHNNLFTVRFFCHLVGEMKKRAVFDTHSDGDLAEKLTEPRSVGTFRKNIQEGMGKELEKLKKVFDAIYQKYNHLAHPKKQLHS